MKILTFQQMALLLTATLCLTFVPDSAPAADAPPATDFPHTIQHELGATEFAPGDRIVITSLRGTRPHLEPGGRYLLEGTYTLTSAETADLALFATSRGPSGSAPIDDAQHVNIKKGSGTFRLTKTLQPDAWLHLSFYVNGQSHGGIYFGEKGVDKTILRQKTWSDFSNKSVSKVEPPPPAEPGASDISDPANLAIMAYLGKPVPAPANLDAKYTPKNLQAAFTDLAKKAGLQVQKLAVDDSEFPYLVYGVLSGKHEFRELESGLRETKDYVYAGSVTGTTDKGATYFALNMIPHPQLPPDQAVACNRRLMVRLQMLADSTRQSD